MNQGEKVAGIKMVGMALKALEAAVPLLGATSEEGRDVLQSMTRLGRHVPPGAVTPQDMMNTLKAMVMKQQQFGQQMQAMKGAAAAPGGGAGGAAPPSPAAGGGAPPQMHPGGAPAAA